MDVQRVSQKPLCFRHSKELLAALGAEAADNSDVLPEGGLNIYIKDKVVIKWHRI